jgi:hypothetical protein
MTHHAWAGSRVRRLTTAVLTAKGTTCHLCSLPGADSPDHDPPRSTLIAQGWPDPDALRFLFPSHRLCNIRRKRRPITDELRTELRTARLADLAHNDDPVRRSTRFAGGPR